MKKTVLLFGVSFAIIGQSMANIIITEVMHNPINQEPIWEFIELHNAGNTSVDLQGYQLTDENGFVGNINTSFVLDPNETMVITLPKFSGGVEDTLNLFNNEWGSAITFTSDNLYVMNDFPTYDPEDVVTLLDNMGNIEDQFDYSDPSLPDENGLSWALDAFNSYTWVQSQAGQLQAVTATSGSVGSPGLFVNIPEPSSLGLGFLGLLCLRIYRRK